MSDYIPDQDEEFNTYATTQFVPYATGNAADLGISPADAAALSALLAQWTYAWAAYLNHKTSFASATDDKDTRRADLEAAIRTATAGVQANKNVTNGQREALGVTVRKTTRTPTPVPTSTPAIQRIDTSTRSILRLFYVDATTPESRAKPAGVQGCEIREQIGGPFPADPEDMELLAVETRMPYRADFEAPDVGKTVYFALRWRNSRGEPGPWSQIYSAVVPS